MQEETREDRIRDLMARTLGWKSTTLLGPLTPFDISKPNIHNSKKEFVLERDAVRSVMEHIRKIIWSVYAHPKKSKREHKQMVARLGEAIDEKARQGKAGAPVLSASDLARKNIAEAGFHQTMFRVLADMHSAYDQRLKELEEQEAEFWSVSHRPPHYYARTIALRFAKFYARETKSRPKFGTARDGGHPSTDYGRILEKVFKILEIDADLRGPAQWAISKITDEDINPPPPSLTGGFRGLGVPGLLSEEWYPDLPSEPEDQEKGT